MGWDDRHSTRSGLGSEDAAPGDFDYQPRVKLPPKAERRKGRSIRSYRKRVSKAKRRRVFERDGLACVACGTGEELSIDHVIPIAKGGTNDESNLQTMCAPCNNAKGNRIGRGQRSAAVRGA
jgi:5-methylcytosine-specific restriction endonuclease McrA